MRQKFTRFLIRLTLFSFLLGLIAIVLFMLLPENTLPGILPYLYLLFFLTTMAVHWVLLRITDLKPGKFVAYFMLTTFLKLILYFIVILIYVFTTKERTLTFILSFFILYIFYTTFEVVTILAQTRQEEHS